MRTSGGGRDHWMTAVPLAVLLLFGLVAAGGPNKLLIKIERGLATVVSWVTGTAS